MHHVYLQITSLLPRSATAKIKKLMVQSGIDSLSARTYLGFTIFFAVSIALIVFFLSPFVIKDAHLVLLLSAGSLAGILGTTYLLLSLNVDSRSREIEEFLPDSLQLISSNIRAGMTLENAIWSAGRPEFGHLKDEIRKVSADTFGGKRIEDALDKMTNRVNSKIVQRTIKLITEGIRLGGEMAPLLDEVSNDIKSTQQLQKEIITTTTTYAIFITFAAVVASPLLFSVSSFYSQMNEELLGKQLEQSQKTDFSSLPSSGIPSIGLGKKGANPEEKISSEEIRQFSFSAIAITSFFAALILSTMTRGSAKEGLKYAFIYAAIAIVIYTTILGLLSGALGGIIS
ncbi:MAG: type II secretion system F family protein [Candidatus Micrarchaeia archaeon]